jgi:phosphoglycolate phosphatase
MPPLSNIRGILFDKDGTLVDFNRTWFGIVMALARRAASGDEQTARDLVEAGGYDWQQQRFLGGSVVAAGTIADLVELWHPGLEAGSQRERIASYDSFAVEEGARRAAGVDGLHTTLARLVEQGFQLGIATNDSEAGARATAEALGLTSLFSAMIGYDSVPRAKPFPDQLRLFATSTGLPVEAIAMVGDNTHDLEMAHAAGAGLAIGVLSGNSTRAELTPRADIILDSIADLPGLFAGG